MDEARVARRCFDLIHELLEFTQSHVRQRQRLERQDTRHAQDPVPRFETDRSDEANKGLLNPVQSNMNDPTWAMNPSMSGIWASMMDPIALEGFVVGDEPMEGGMYDNSWFGAM